MAHDDIESRPKGAGFRTHPRLQLAHPAAHYRIVPRSANRTHQKPEHRAKVFAYINKKIHGLKQKVSMDQHGLAWLRFSAARSFQPASWGRVFVFMLGRVFVFMPWSSSATHVHNVAAARHDQRACLEGAGLREAGEKVHLKTLPVAYTRSA